MRTFGVNHGLNALLVQRALEHKGLYLVELLLGEWLVRVVVAYLGASKLAEDSVLQVLEDQEGQEEIAQRHDGQLLTS